MWEFFWGLVVGWVSLGALWYWRSAIKAEAQRVLDRGIK